MIDFDKILFRSSGVGHIMTEAKGKTNLEKYTEAVAKLSLYEGQLAVMKPGLKSTENKYNSIIKLRDKVKELELIKDEIKLSHTAKTHCVDIFVSEHYGRREEIVNKVLEKGNIQEDDSITLLCLVKDLVLRKNTKHFSNEFIKGTPDCIISSGGVVTAIIDTKSSWSANTFFRTQIKPVDPLYYWQGQAYMALTGATNHTVAYCLVNATGQMIIDEKRKLAYAMHMDFTKLSLSMILNNPFTDEEKKYCQRCKQIEINMIYDLSQFAKDEPKFKLENETWEWDIPADERVFTIPFERNDSDIERMYQRVKDCRKWMRDQMFKETIEVNGVLELIEDENSN